MSPIATEYRSKSTIATIDLVAADLHPGNYLPRSKATGTTAAKASTHFRDYKCYPNQRETSTIPTTRATPQAHTAPTIHADLNLAVPEQNRTCILPSRKGKSTKCPYQGASMAIQQALTALKYIRVLDNPQGGTNLTSKQHKEQVRHSCRLYDLMTIMIIHSTGGHQSLIGWVRHQADSWTGMHYMSILQMLHCTNIIYQYCCIPLHVPTCVAVHT